MDMLDGSQKNAIMDPYYVLSAAIWIYENQKRVDARGVDPVISTAKICKDSDLPERALKAEMSTPIMIITMIGNG